MAGFTAGYRSPSRILSNLPCEASSALGHVALGSVVCLEGLLKNILSKDRAARAVPDKSRALAKKSRMLLFRPFFLPR